MLSTRDIREFRGFLRNATDRQVQGIYDKEKRAGRDDYADLAVAEAARRGIILDDHATKKRRRRPDRPLTKAEESALQARGRKAAADGLMGMRLDDQLRAEGLSRTEHHVVRVAFNDALETLERPPSSRHSTKKKSRAQLDREIAAALHGGTRRSHATTQRAVPGVAKWSMTAGGTGAARDKHGYTFTVPQGTYHIWPHTKNGRHAGYVLRFAATHGRPIFGHSGLWHELGNHRSPQSAASAAAKHHAGGFE